MHTTVDVLFSVVDNFGDMGFACELMIAYERVFPGIFSFRIIVDDVPRTESFFRKNDHLLGEYQIYSSEMPPPGGFSSIVFVLFHFPLPEISPDQKRLILRFDYLSFDSDWVSQNGNEHIKSDNCTKIIEIIPSVLPMGSGILPHHLFYNSRSEWLNNHNISGHVSEKKWISMFIYGSTTVRIDWESFNDDWVIFLLGGEQIKQTNIITLPFLSIEEYYQLLSMTDMNIIRGEVSFVQSLQSGIPFLWDMYKEKGGFFHLQSQQFLDFGSLSTQYRLVHAKLNGQLEGKVSVDDISMIQETFPSLITMIKRDTKDLVHETKKYIDRFYFSL